jgi:hypothetical protein
MLCHGVLTGSNPVLTTKNKDMKQALETIIHDFLMDPLHYITLALAGVLICVLIGGAITSII